MKGSFAVSRLAWAAVAAAGLGLVFLGLGHTLWVGVLAAAPAAIVGGLHLAAGDSLLPHLGALVAVPLGLAGIIGGATARPRRIR